MGKVQDWSVTTCLLLFMFQASQIYCTTQTDVLNRLYRSKKGIDSSVDTSHYNAIRRLSVSLLQNKSNVNQQELREKDRIQNLPGQPLVTFKQYGGYVTVNESSGRSLYYYFVEATKNNNSSPLVLWLNGGPGCSSLGYGAFKELGPFRVQSDGKTLHINPYSWNNVANILFLESPVGTGFSYTNTKSDLENLGDMKATVDNYVFLVKWLDRFPEYKGREFYIAGESYAGHYIPHLAQTILLHNNNQTFINLRGIMMGNAALDQEDPIVAKEFLAGHYLISQETFLSIKENCGPESPSRNMINECSEMMKKIDNDLKHLNQYNILAPFCLNSTLTNEPKECSTVMKSDPCIDHYVTAYFNKVEVQSSMHVVTSNTNKLPYTWKLCSGAVEFWNENDMSTSMLPILRELMSHENLRIWIYNGDVDASVSFTSTMHALKKMNLTVVKQWHAWSSEGLLEGYTEDYKENIKFVTVIGAGHEVPYYKPNSALTLFTNFILNSPLSNKGLEIHANTQG